MRLPLIRLLLVCLVVNIFVLVAGNNHSLAGDWPPGAQGASPLLPKPTATPTATPSATPTPTPPILLADCIPRDGFVHCHDRLLALDFAYPSFFGDLVETQLRAGGIEGIAYEYKFAESNLVPLAGGRSRVFSEARGGMFTDQRGFGDRSSAQVCAESGYASCREIKPGVLLAVLAIEGQYLCPEGMPGGVMDAQVLVNLPHHSVINGFGFFTRLLSPEEEQGLRHPLDLDHVDDQCDAETLAAYDRDRLALVAALEAGTAPPDIQARYAGMLRLAQSITGPYVSDDLSATLPQPTASQCNATQPNGIAPPGASPSRSFFGNGIGLLWTQLWPGGIVLITDDSQVRADGAYLVDFPWWRAVRGQLEIEVGPAASGLEVIIPAGYGDEGFQPSTLVFPSAGCWQVTGRVEMAGMTQEQLAFTVEVRDVRAQ